MLANPVSPKDTIGYSSENKTFQVVYSRPYKNDRLIFGPEMDGARLYPLENTGEQGLMQQQHLKHLLMFCLTVKNLELENTLFLLSQTKKDGK